MNISKSLNFQFFLILLLFVAPYFGVALIHLTILGILIYFILKIKNYEFELVEKILIVFGIYLILSSILNLNYLLNSIFFFKFIILFLGVKILFFNFSEKNFQKINIVSLIIIIFLIFDLFYQKIFGEDIFGFKTLNGERLTGPYKNEMIPGGIILYVSFYFIFYNYLKFLFSNKYTLKVLSFFILFIFVISVLITGERMNFLSVLLLLLASLIIINKKLHIIFSLFVISASIFVIFNDEYLTDRYKNFANILNPTLSEQSFNTDEIKKFKEETINNENGIKSKYDVNFFDTTWGSHYLTAFEMIKKKPFFGNGIKSFRDLCGNQNINSVTKDKRCSTHPHNIHLEIISETGLIGYLIYIIFVLLLLINSYKIIISKKYQDKSYLYLIFISSLLIFIIMIFPFKSTGRFFSSFFGYLFWFNLSVLNASIFTLKKQYLKNL